MCLAVGVGVCVGLWLVNVGGALRAAILVWPEQMVWLSG